MKKLALVIGIVLMLTTTALAEIDFSTMTPEELVSIISMAGSTLEKFNPVEDDKVLYDKDGFAATIHSIDYKPKYDEIQLNLTLINDTDEEACIFFSDVLINGWAVDSHYHNRVPSHAKSRDVYISIEEICKLAGLESFDEIESIEAFGIVSVNDNYKHMHYIMTYTNEEGLKFISREYLD